MQHLKKWQGVIAASALVLCGCSAADSSPAKDSSHSGTHKMPDGSTMSDKDMATMDKTASADAAMVCSDEITDHLVSVLGLDKSPRATSTFANKILTCDIALDEGTLTLSVHDVTDPDVGKRQFGAVKARLDNPKEFEGMYGAGLPSFETPQGDVVFLKDSKTLHVDATKLRGKIGQANTMSGNELAYSVAMAVVACWTE